VKVGRK